MLPFSRPLRIETERLVLRPLRPDDAAPLFADYTSDPEVCRHLPWRRHGSRAETEAMIRHAEEAAGARSAYLLAIAPRARPDHPIGLFNLGDGDHGISIGFGLSRPSWGRRYGGELATRLLTWLLGQPSVWRVWGYCDVENRASAATMEKAGMLCEGRLRRYAVHPNLSAEPRDCQLFAAVRSG